MSTEQARGLLQERLGYHFRDPELLAQALRHESYANDEGLASNERLEFLGDSVLGLVVAESLFGAYPDLPEGKLALMKSNLVSTEQLAEVGRQLGVGECVELGRAAGEGSRQRANLLADAVEALLGAIFLEAGLEEVRLRVRELLREPLSLAHELRRDFKSALQEVTQRDFQVLPDYIVVDECGPPHDRTFQVRVDLQGQVLGLGSGRSKREAAQQAAQQALQSLEGARQIESEEPAAEPLGEEDAGS